MVRWESWSAAIAPAGRAEQAESSAGGVRQPGEVIGTGETGETDGDICGGGGVGAGFVMVVEIDAERLRDGAQPVLRQRQLTCAHTLVQPYTQVGTGTRL